MILFINTTSIFYYLLQQFSANSYEILAHRYLMEIEEIEIDLKNVRILLYMLFIIYCFSWSINKLSWKTTSNLNVVTNNFK